MLNVRLESVNPCITCKICKGYLIAASTVTECLHTFCKSCLVQHLENRNTCPECEVVIDPVDPLKHVRFDRTLQDIVYKLVPKLEESELKRERDFYQPPAPPITVPASQEVNVTPTTWQGQVSVELKEFEIRLVDLSPFLKIRKRLVKKKAIPYSCLLCLSTFKTLENLNRHVEEIHGYVKTIPSKTRALLENHDGNVHPRERPFICNVCGKAFKFRGCLAIHSKRVHRETIQIPRSKRNMFMTTLTKMKNSLGLFK